MKSARNGRQKVSMSRDDRLIYLVFTAQQKLRTHLKNAMADAGVSITPAQSGILFLLKKKNGQTMSELSSVLSLDNSTLTGLVDRLERAAELAKARGARRLIPLNVSGAFHSTLMQPVAAEFDRVLQSVTFHEPRIPVVSNVTSLPLTNSASIKQELLSQLRRCIQWQSSVEYMTRNGVTTYYEIGPGTVLAGLIKRISPEALTINIAGVEDIAALDDPAPDAAKAAPKMD